MFSFEEEERLLFDWLCVAMPPLSLQMCPIDAYEMANVFAVLSALILYHITCVLFFFSVTDTQNSIGKSDLRTIYSILTKNYLLL